MEPPGVALTSPSDLVTDRSGAAVTGVSSVPVLSPGVGSGPLVPSSATTTELPIAVTPAGSAASTVTANSAVPDAPAPSDPTVSVHVLPVQAQPGVEAPALKVVLAGTVSVSTTPVAACVPALAYDSVQVMVDPGVAVAPASDFVTDRSGVAVT